MKIHPLLVAAVAAIFIPIGLSAESIIELSEDVEAATQAQNAGRRLTFNRPFDEARPFERDALAVVNYALEARGEQPFPRQGEPLHLSSVFLGEGSDESELTIFFQSASVGGSGTTLYTSVAVPIPYIIGGYRLDIEFSMCGGGSVVVYASTFLQDTIVFSDSSEPPVEYLPTVKYEENTAE